jgi:hypothetical protein
MHDISKGLEVWTLQTLLNVSILMGLMAMGFSLVQSYYEAVQKHLTLRVSIEIWNIFTVIIVDFLLLVVVAVGFMILNPDIMADIKVAVPFIPVATILFAVALIIRLFYGGHHVKGKSFMVALWFTFVANMINIIGFSLVMEAPSGEYLAVHPSAFWTFVKSYLRSNADPHGLEIAQITFYICFPILIGIFIWGFVVALRQLKQQGGA